MVSKGKLNKQDFMFRNKTGEVLIKNPGQVNGMDFAINNLKDCQVFVCDNIAQVRKYSLKKDMKKKNIIIFL